MSVTVTDICRYPVKGLNAESLDRVELSIGDTLPHDRRFAIAHGTTRFDVSTPCWLSKDHFLNLANDEKLAQLRAAFDEKTGELSISRDGKQVVKAKASDIMGRTLIGQFFAGFMASAARGTPKLLEAPGHNFTDVPEKYVTLISLASVRDLERVARESIDPLRFRGNFYIDGLPAWQEFEWAGQEIGLGAARLRVVDAVDRCAATNVNPETAARDMNIPLTLRKGFRHRDMGVYALVVEAGGVAKGDGVRPPV
jgi:uncharacterized protein YcbX